MLYFFILILSLTILMVSIFLNVRKEKFYNWTPMKKNVIIAGCVYRCANHLDRVFDNISLLIKFFNDYRIVIAYDESPDKSLSILERYEKKLNMFVLKGKKQSKIRTQNICNARNKILDWIRNQEFKATYMIMLDFDDVCAKPMNLDVLDDAFKNEKLWDSISFHRDKNYYDIWALSFYPYFISCFHWDKPPVLFIKKKITSVLNYLPTDNYFQVYSAFNGFAIYKLELFLYSHYEWEIHKSMAFLTDEMIQENKNALKNICEMDIKKYSNDCEHRYFHFKAVFEHDAKIVISPKFLFQ